MLYEKPQVGCQVVPCQQQMTLPTIKTPSMILCAWELCLVPWAVVQGLARALRTHTKQLT